MTSLHKELNIDIRHCYANIQKTRKLLNFKPTISLEDGLTELAGWAKAHGWGATDLFEKALKELSLYASPSTY